MDDPFIIRNYVPSDEPYIMSTWLRDMRKEDRGSLPSDIWYNSHREYIKRIFSDKEVQVLVLATADNPNEIIGYAVGIPERVLFWCQIRQGKLRSQGLSKRLLTQLKCLPSTPAALTSAMGRRKLLNPYRGYELRHLMASH